MPSKKSSSVRDPPPTSQANSLASVGRAGSRASSRRISPTLTDEEGRLKAAILTWPMPRIKAFFKQQRVPMPPTLTTKLDMATRLVATMAARRFQGERDLPVRKKKKQPTTKKKPKSSRKRKFDLTTFSAGDKRALLAQLLKDQDQQEDDNDGQEDDGLGLGSFKGSKSNSKGNLTPRPKKKQGTKKSTGPDGDASGNDEPGSGDDPHSSASDQPGESDEDDKGDPYFKIPLEGNEAAAKEFLLREISSAVKVAVDEAMRTQKTPGSSQNTGLGTRDAGSNPGTSLHDIFAARDRNEGGGGTVRRDGGSAGDQNNPWPNRDLESWRRVPNDRRDSEALEAFANLYDVAKRAICGGIPVSLQAWQKMTHSHQMASRLSQLDSNGDLPG